ncbi:hypothetical protein [Arsenicicoccus sp. oral taxon 190]|uniref:hypothetical protein n=1 Tax=Arsenicicoccus sp. oral taxon 190 TaxID=1658671 RepID=UPI0012E19B42|nr:hypothetical protein [Arsenicicoccus sp. oral taxon 190]
MLLVRGRREQVIRWVRRGTLPVHVVPGTPWTALVPAGPSRAAEPYADGVAMLAAHPVRLRLKPAVGLWVDGDRAVITCWPSRWRRGQRWVQWLPGEGPGPVTGFPLARPVDLAQATGFGRQEGAPGAIRDLLGDPGGTAADVLEDLAVLLGLPHAAVLRGKPAGDLPGAELVVPADEAVQRFEKVVTDEQRLDTEVEEGL